MNSLRSQIVDLAATAWQPAGWDSWSSPPLVRPQDISIYELHVRDFSIFDETVPEDERGTFKAFTYTDSDGMSHLLSLARSGADPPPPPARVRHCHHQRRQGPALAEPDYALLVQLRPRLLRATGGIINAIRDQDAFNWGYDPFHFTVPEGSYSTNPDGTTRIVEFREMVQNLNENDLCGWWWMWSTTTPTRRGKGKIRLRPHCARLLPSAERQRGRWKRAPAVPTRPANTP
jgi:pullulanase